MKIAINRCFGGFGLSDEACALLKCAPYTYDADIMRNDFNLISVIEQLGDKANGCLSKIEIVKIPDEATDYEINEYDGMETVTYVLNGKLYHA